MRRLVELTPAARAGGVVFCALGLMLGASALAQTAGAPAAAPAAATTPPAGPEGLSEGVVVTVNDDMISTYDIIQRMRLLIVTSGIQPTEKNMPALQQEAARSLVDERLEMQDLRTEGKTQKFDLIASDAEVNDELADIARSNNTSADQLLAQLAAQGVGAETLKDQLRAEISWRGWIRGRYGSRIVIGDDQIKAYQKRIEADSGKPQYQVNEIFIDAARAGDINAATTGAQQLIDQMHKGAPFAAVARQFSNSPSAAAGGDVGWISTGEMPAEVDQALEALRPGQLSGPIPVKDGVYIIYLKDKRAGGSTPVVDLKQAAIALPKSATEAQVAEAQAKLLALRAKLNGCDNLAAQAAKVQGVVAGDLGEAETKDLSPAFREVAERLDVGQISDPIRTEAGVHLVAVCAKHMGGAQQVTREQIENRLFGQELAMIAKRQLRDLRNSATIEIR
ncbi:MAG TPA: peptidylprolyl isomerase [Caulobacteraceae bacterium]|jgi:peptidyl-prolyl cis-trans isomerase SurA